jgi:hypothetical protein
MSVVTSVKTVGSKNGTAGDDLGASLETFDRIPRR